MGGGGGGGGGGWVVVGVLVACSNIPILFEETFNCPTVKAERESQRTRSVFALCA